MSRLETEAQNATCPIYGVRGALGEPLGSGFLLGVESQVLLVTAAHVLHWRHEYTLHLPGEEQIVPFEGRAYLTGPRRPVSCPDFKHDLAFVALSPQSAKECRGCPVLVPEHLDIDELPVRQTLYGFAGFPVSENQVLAGRKFFRHSYYYGGLPAPQAVYAALGYSPLTHFVMTFDRGRMVDSAGNLVTVPEPFGMSGGPVWKLGSFEDIDTGVMRPRIVALGIEWSQAHCALVGVRVALLVEGIRQALPSLAAYLPAPQNVRVSVTII